MAYFTIYQGLRGCYMPDSAYTIKADTRRELKAALTWEADSIRDAGGVGMSKKAITSLAATSWHWRKKGAEFVAPYRWQYHKTGCYPLALGVFTGITRQEYLDNQEV